MAKRDREVNLYRLAFVLALVQACGLVGWLWWCGARYIG